MKAESRHWQGKHRCVDTVRWIFICRVSLLCLRTAWCFCPTILQRRKLDGRKPGGVERRRRASSRTFEL